MGEEEGWVGRHRWRWEGVVVVVVRRWKWWLWIWRSGGFRCWILCEAEVSD